MKSKFMSALYSLNIIAQSIFTLLTPALLFFFVAWLFVTRVGAPSWIYVIAIVLGILSGLYSMVKFVITAGKNLERLEKQNKTGKNNEQK